jgi:group I intron endonuclease
MIGIYKITSPTGRVYVGQSIDILRRFKSYKKYPCPEQIKLHHSFLKYGVEAHAFEVLQECSIEDLNERERYWQDYYNVITHGLNCKLTGTADARVVFSGATLLKMSKNMTGPLNRMYGRPLDPHPMQGRTGSLSPIYGRKHTAETKKLQSEKAQGRPVPESAKEKISAANGKKVVNTKTNEVFNSIRKAADSAGIKAVTLKACLSGKFKNKTTFELWTPRN